MKTCWIYFQSTVVWFLVPQLRFFFAKPFQTFWIILYISMTKQFMTISFHTIFLIFIFSYRFIGRNEEILWFLYVTFLSLTTIRAHTNIERRTNIGRDKKRTFRCSISSILWFAYLSAFSVWCEFNEARWIPHKNVI